MFLWQAMRGYAIPHILYVLYLILLLQGTDVIAITLEHLVSLFSLQQKSINTLFLFLDMMVIFELLRPNHAL